MLKKSQTAEEIKKQDLEEFAAELDDIEKDDEYDDESKIDQYINKAEEELKEQELQEFINIFNSIEEDVYHGYGSYLEQHTDEEVRGFEEIPLADMPLPLRRRVAKLGLDMLDDKDDKSIRFKMLVRQYVRDAFFDHLKENIEEVKQLATEQERIITEMKQKTLDNFTAEFDRFEKYISSGSNSDRAFISDAAKNTLTQGFKELRLSDMPPVLQSKVVKIINNRDEIQCERLRELDKNLHFACSTFSGRNKEEIKRLNISQLQQEVTQLRAKIVLERISIANCISPEKTGLIAGGFGAVASFGVAAVAFLKLPALAVLLTEVLPFALAMAPLAQAALFAAPVALVAGFMISGYVCGIAGLRRVREETRFEKLEDKLLNTERQLQQVSR